MPRISLILLLPLMAGPAVPGVAQVTKPQPVQYRLPKPASIAATQQSDGTIRVVWSAVPEAASYKLFRSVPPAAMTRVSLANPSDTQYVDTDVKAGSTYYYLVTAVNEAGSEGLRAGSAPLTVSGASQTLAAGGDPDGGSESGGDAPAAVAAPTNVVAKPWPYRNPTISWQSSLSGARFIVERMDPVVYVSEQQKAAWKKIPSSDADGAWRCCQMYDRSPPPFAYLRYRVTAIEPSSGRQSVPTESRGFNNEAIKTATSLNADGFKVGEKRQLVGAPGGLNMRTWASLDTTIASVCCNGVVTAKSWGVTYVVTNMKVNEEILSVIYRVHVE